MLEPCDICASSEMYPVLEVSLIGKRRVQVHRCRSCGFRQIRPRLTADQIKALYPSDYFDAGSPVGYADYAREFQRRQREAYFLNRWLRRLGSEGRLLEVGCALGFLLTGLQRSGWRVEGVDASAFAVHYASTRYGIDVACATLEEARFPDAAFDVVIQKDLLEHVADPRAHLEETRRVLRSDGWLRLVTPNGEANLRPLIAASGMTGGRPLPVLDQGRVAKGIEVDDNVWLGAHVVIADGARVGRDAIIGAGAVVRGEVPPFQIAAGIPAKVIRDRRIGRDRPPASGEL